MSSKQIFTTIVCAVVMTITTLKLWAICISDFVVRGDEITVMMADEHKLFSLSIWFLIYALAWKAIFPARDIFNIVLVEGVAFPIFMLFVTGWFTFSGGTANFNATLSVFIAYMVSATIGFVTACVAGEFIGSQGEVKPKHDS